MTDALRIMELPGQACHLKSNESFPLDDPQSVWVVQSGLLNLSIAPGQKEEAQTARRYLGSVGTGEALFGALPAPEAPFFELVAVPVEDTQLLKVSVKELLDYCVDDQTQVVALVDSWIARLNATCATLSAPETPEQSVENEHYSLGSSESLQPQPGSILWIHIEQGCAKWMGLADLTLDETSGPVPLTAGMWIEADGVVELTTLSTSRLQPPGAALEGLILMQTYLLRGLGLLDRRQKQAVALRFQEREHRTQQMQEAALHQLAAVLQPKKTETLSTEGTPLLVAARAVGQALGMTILPPGRSEDPKRLNDPLEAIGRASRVRIREVLLTDAWWQKDCGPLLAYTRNGNQPVALLPVSPTRYELFDPVRMTRTPVSARLAATISPVAHMLYRSFPDKARSAIELLKFAIKGHARTLITILLTSIAGTILGMLAPQATSILIDKAIPDADRNALVQIGLALLLAAFGRTLFQLAQGVALLRLETASSSTVQAAMWDWLLNLRPSFFREYSTGDLQSRVTAVSTIREKLSGTTIRTLFSSFIALLNLALMLYYSVPLAIVASCAVFLIITVTTTAGILTVRQVRPLHEISANIFGLMVQLIGRVATLRVAGAEERAFVYWAGKYSEQQTLKRRIQRIQDHLSVFNEVMPTVTYTVLFFFAVLSIQQALASDGTGLTPGTFLAFHAAFGVFIGAATGLSNTIIDALEITTLWKRAKPIIDAEPEMDASKADPGRLSGKLVLDHVSFRYHEGGGLILDDVSIRVEPGEFIALVGPSGCGKSTIFRLLLGFEAPEAGTIYYDDQDLGRINVYAVRRQLGIVMQNAKIMAASIYANIAGSAPIALEEAAEAARAAGFADDIANMPMGMHTVISEGGTNLSGGQRQRLLIARALVFKPRILLFDEATSALDNRTQAIVSESLDKLRVSRIVIAHRLSTIRHADRIYVLDGGHVVQQGSFEELAQQEGLFARLIARQMA